MKKFTVFLLGVVLAFGLATNVLAVPFTFSGSDAGGTGSASMEINISDSVLTLTLDNTSPLTLNGDSGVNTPGITGFGFSLLNGAPPISDWTLSAYDSGASPIDLRFDWVDATFFDGISADFIVHTPGGNIQGALYNPAATEGFGALPNYFTTAMLTVEFDDPPILDPTSPFVRMQNVGLGGEGSLKLFPIPEPATMLLLGAGLIGLAGLGRKRFVKKT